MTITDDDREFLRLIKNQSTERNVGVLEYFNAMLATLQNGEDKYPDNQQAAQKYALALLNERYPIVS